MTSAMKIRTFEDSDVPAILELLRTSLGENDVLSRSPELFSWKHVENPFGRSIMLIAEDGDGIVGFRAFMRWELATLQGGRLRCVRPVDTATHPRARRMGVFRQLTETAVEVSRNEGVDLIFNTPNPRSGAGYRKMGWQEVGPIGVLIRPLRRFLHKARDLPVIEGDRWRGREPADRRPLGLRTPRRGDYLEWRFSLHPTARYTVSQAADGSVAVLRSNIRNGRGELAVSDLFGPAAASAVRGALSRTNAAYVAGWASPGTPERSALLKARLMPVPGFRALTLFARPLRSLDMDVTQLVNWDLLPSDLELL